MRMTLSVVLLMGVSPMASLNAAGQAERPQPRKSEPGAGLLYYAKADFAFAESKGVIANPYIRGALFQVIWSEVEREKGQCDWSQLDQWMAPWLKAGKKAAIRILWSTSGYWPKPYYKTPTPKWVWKEGAVFAFHQPSGTEIPLIWDPIYEKYAWRFLEQLAARYDGNPGILFVDVTPGAETNPYRFGTIGRSSPEFKDEFEKIKASDGRAYNEELWLATVKQWVDASDRIFKATPLLVTLNVGGLRTGNRLPVIGGYCASKGFYVGQNGLSGRSYMDPESDGTRAFRGWSRQTRLFFEMVSGTNGRAGDLMDVMKAAERIGCDYLNVYPEDVLRGTRGQTNFDPAFEEALRYGAQTVGKGQGARPAGSPKPASEKAAEQTTETAHNLPRRS